MRLLEREETLLLYSVLKQWDTEYTLSMQLR